MSPRIGPSGPLSHDRIVSVAIELADRDGLEAVSMRRVADRLETGPASLYRHLANRDDLVATMVDHVTGRHEYPDATDLDWRTCMHLLARQDYTTFLAHPWLLTATSTATPPFGTASLAAMEWALTALTQLRLPPHDAGRAVMTINHYVQGTARVVLGERPAGAGPDPGRNWQQRLRNADLGDFPLLRELISDRLPDEDRDWFEDGLDVILDGIQARQPALGAAAVSPPPRST